MNFSLAEEIERRNRALGKKQNKMGMKFNNIIVHPPQCCYGGQTEATGMGGGTSPPDAPRLRARAMRPYQFISTALQVRPTPLLRPPDVSSLFGFDLSAQQARQFIGQC
jgi:hypothetical protein